MTATAVIHGEITHDKKTQTGSYRLNSNCGFGTHSAGNCYSLELQKNHFLEGMQIAEVDCSYLTIDSAMEKVAEKYREQKCKFTFSTGQTQEVSLGKLGVKLDETKFLKIFNEQHENREAKREYNIEDVISVDRKLLEVELRRIPQLQEQNMRKPRNARVA